MLSDKKMVNYFKGGWELFQKLISRKWADKTWYRTGVGEVPENIVGPLNQITFNVPDILAQYRTYFHDILAEKLKKEGNRIDDIRMGISNKNINAYKEACNKLEEYKKSIRTAIEKDQIHSAADWEKRRKGYSSGFKRDRRMVFRRFMLNLERDRDRASANIRKEARALYNGLRNGVSDTILLKAFIDEMYKGIELAYDEITPKYTDPVEEAVEQAAKISDLKQKLDALGVYFEAKLDKISESFERSFAEFEASKKESVAEFSDDMDQVLGLKKKPE